ncbi:hypothetical protein [Candidatus Blastococcus massiliensis]|uniref:hypothetical protein n=1 Tax=Candidatus Blastococcus massiliensis TaxID=1470358 RepID=UPI000590AD72|nr:hypothetical protein [Candidatus Blastococcus massiliensis]
MTSSQPPQPPVGGQPPHGQQPPQQPAGYGPPPGQQPPTPGPGAHGQPAGTGGSGVSFDAKRLRMADYAIAGLTLLFLVLSLFKWYTLDADFFGGDFGVRGWANGDVKLAFFLFLLATVWTVLPAFTDIKLGFPRSWITVALAALGFLFALLAWFDTFDELYEFSVFALLGMITAAAILLFAVLSLLPELRNGPALPGALGGAAQWANRPASGPGQPGQPGQTYGQQGPPPPPPPPAGPSTGV